MLIADTIELASADGPSLVSTFCPAEGHGLSTCSPVDTATNAHTHYVGPRHDQTDTTNFYLTP
ncbi:MAG TPA: hypothetical protein VHV78_16205, partial [Gemmatimonadaceae bacterium]|nr:hypothetical protein [Gemmatimonadaceae bacterium]